VHKLENAVLCCDACTIFLSLWLRQAPQHLVRNLTQFQPTAAQQRPNYLQKIDLKMLLKQWCPRSTSTECARKQQEVDGAVVGYCSSKCQRNSSWWKWGSATDALGIVHMSCGSCCSFGSACMISVCNRSNTASSAVHARSFSTQTRSTGASNSPLHQSTNVCCINL
jgi:hypothetical protein